MKLMDQKNNGGFNQFALGIIIGGILGILYAPKEGKETRRALKELLKLWEEKDGQLTGEIKDKVAEVREVAEPMVMETKEKIEPFINEIKPIVQEKIAQATDLLEPIAQDVAKETEEKMAEVVDPVIEKARAELNETIEQARRGQQSELHKPHPKYF